MINENEINLLKDMDFFNKELDADYLRNIQSVLGAQNRVAPLVISELDKDEIFVFGSNIKGKHKGRASKHAVKDFGAEYGQGEGLQGKSYAIPTVGLPYPHDLKSIKNEKELAKAQIENAEILKPYVRRFIDFARDARDPKDKEKKLKFLVTRIGCGWGGFSDEAIAPLFKDALMLDNVYLPQSFLDVLFNRKFEEDNPSRMVPSTFSHVETFAEELTARLTLYLQWLRANSSTYFPDNPIKALGVIDKVEGLCSAIYEAVDKMYRGLPATAYSILSDAINMACEKDSEKELPSINPYQTIAKGSSFYRLRSETDNWEKRLIDKKGMFHIPKDKRGRITTQRYSIHGFPCLYLGEHLSACWEELGRPNLNACMFSRFECNSSFKVLDLTIPAENEWKKNRDKIYDRLVLFPLVIASTFKGSPRSASFKPEYIIPQILLQFVKEHSFNIRKNRLFRKDQMLKKIIEEEVEEFRYTAMTEKKDSLDISKLVNSVIVKYGKMTAKQKELEPASQDESTIYGIKYTSVNLPTEGIQCRELYSNYVLPVTDIKEAHCRHLKRLFRLTDPFCEEIARGTGRQINISEDVTKQTVFDKIESILKDESNYPLSTIDQ